ncbi:MAG: hypothetical protein R3C19_21135 [Planctomycetaceae bacterium]
MLIPRSVLPALLFLTTIPFAAAQDHTVEIIDEAPKADSLSAELAAQFGDRGYRVKRGTRTVCEIWLKKEWDVQPDFKASPTMLYPFTPGQLMGVVHFSRRGSDFRDQTISSGWYTLRFFLQPVDGNHIGTSPTRDFLLLLSAEKDASGKDWTPDDLQAVSAEAAGSAHPAMFCLQPAQEGDVPSMRHNEASDWWILHLTGTGVAAEERKPDVPLDIVVAGHAPE